jgi:SPP1 family predicted phage head-tail adaptor
MPERIGAKRDRIAIQSATPTVDAEGEPIEVWATFVEVWARAEFLSGRELEAMQKINAEISVRLTVNRRTDVITKHRVLWKSPVDAAAEAWNIHAIIPSEDKFDMALLVGKVE